MKNSEVYEIISECIVLLLILTNIKKELDIEWQK